MKFEAFGRLRGVSGAMKIKVSKKAFHLELQIEGFGRFRGSEKSPNQGPTPLCKYAFLETVFFGPPVAR